MKRWLLVLGAGVYQVPLIAAAQRLGFATLVTSRLGNYPGIHCADQFVAVDTTDITGTIALARQYQIAGVVTAGTDVAVPTLGAVVDAMGLNGPHFDATMTCSNKVKMKRALARAGVPTASFDVALTLDEAIKVAKRITYPVMVKAVDSSGSRGVTRVDSEDKLPKAWFAAAAVSRSPEILVERCLDGIEFGAQCVLIGSDPVLTLPHNDSVTAAPVSTPIGHSFPALLPKSCEERVAEIVALASNALGLASTAVNFDFLWANDKAYVLEVGARIGATCLPELLSGYTGLDVYELLVRISVGERPTVTPRKSQPVAAMLLRSARAGTVQQITIPQHIACDPRVLECKLDVQSGDAVQAFSVGPDRIGHIVVHEKTAQEAESLANRYADEIRIKVE